MPSNATPASATATPASAQRTHVVGADVLGELLVLAAGHEALGAEGQRLLVLVVDALRWVGLSSGGGERRRVSSSKVVATSDAARLASQLLQRAADLLRTELLLQHCTQLGSRPLPARAR